MGGDGCGGVRPITEKTSSTVILGSGCGTGDTGPRPALGGGERIEASADGVEIVVVVGRDIAVVEARNVCTTDAGIPAAATAPVVVGICIMARSGIPAIDGERGR
jgi:hypothetical protein